MNTSHISGWLKSISHLILLSCITKSYLQAQIRISSVLKWSYQHGPESLLQSDSSRVPHRNYSSSFVNYSQQRCTIRKFHLLLSFHHYSTQWYPVSSRNFTVPAVFGLRQEVSASPLQGQVQYLFGWCNTHARFAKCYRGVATKTVTGRIVTPSSKYFIFYERNSKPDAGRSDHHQMT